MSRKHSRSQSKNKQLPSIDPEIEERINEQLIFRNQLALTEILMLRLCSSSLDAGFINASTAFSSFHKNFSNFAVHFDKAIEQKIEALNSLTVEY